MSEDRTLETLIRNHVLGIYAETGNNKTQTAEIIDVPVRTLRMWFWKKSWPDAGLIKKCSCGEPASLQFKFNGHVWCRKHYFLVKSHSIQTDG